MNTIEWIAGLFFLLAIAVGFIYSCRGSRERAKEPYETRSASADYLGLGGP